MVLVVYEGSLGEAGERSGDGDFVVVFVDASGVEGAVHDVGGGVFGPGLAELDEAVAAAFGAGAVAGGEGGGFVEEEEFGVFVGGHGAAAAAFEFEEAGDPAAGLVGADDFFVGVDDSAAVAHEVAAVFGADEFAGRGYAVLEWHRWGAFAIS